MGSLHSLSEPDLATIGHSSTVRGIYVLRYLLFSGGTAVAAAMVQRTVWGPQQPGLGLLVGLVLGLVLFRGQLKPVRAPRLSLAKSELQIIRGNNQIHIPWNTVRQTSTNGSFVELELARAPEGLSTRMVRLDAQELGLSAPALQGRIRRHLTTT